jgi:nitrite reductase/ring-hydroxylating ferredoxin subunit
MPRVKIASVSKLPSGAVMPAAAGDESYAVCHAEGAIHVLDGVCPHAGGPLGQGVLHGTTLVCPWHGWEYDCRTGVCTFNDEVRVATYPVTVSGDDVLIEVP